MSYPQYGIYLIPPPHLLHPISTLHNLLVTEFNSYVATQFMVHCTVKGFFKLRDDATPDDFVPQLDALFTKTPALVTTFHEPRIHTGARGKSILLDMERTSAFVDFQEEVFSIVEPYIAPDDLFSATDGRGTTFYPHVTLTQYDTPADPVLAEQQLDLCRYVYAQSLGGEFIARAMQLIRFASDDWAGEWWETLTYEQLKGWYLA